jgi:hypothetical protein
VLACSPVRSIRLATLPQGAADVQQGLLDVLHDEDQLVFSLTGCERRSGEREHAEAPPTTPSTLSSIMV